MSRSEDKHPQWACLRGRQCGVCQKGSRWRRVRSKLRRRALGVEDRRDA